MGDGSKILIADDEQDCIDFVREALADTPYEVIGAMDGEEALAAAQEHAPQLIILDVQMPKLNGFEVFQQLRADEALAGIPVIMLTAVTERTGINFSADDMGEYMGSEPEAYIDKPIEPILLRQAIQRLLKGRGPSA
jgi:two-component system alkaline phosphatase synthesis response regulator PhoP